MGLIPGRVGAQRRRLREQVWRARMSVTTEVPSQALIGGRLGRGQRRHLRGPLPALARGGQRRHPLRRERRGPGGGRRSRGAARLGGDAVDRPRQDPAADQPALPRARRADRAHGLARDRQDDHRLSRGGLRVRGAVLREGRGRGASPPRPLLPLHPGADQQQAPGHDPSAAGSGRRDHPLQLPDRHLLDRARAHHRRRQHGDLEAVRVLADLLRDGGRGVRGGRAPAGGRQRRPGLRRRRSGDRRATTTSTASSSPARPPPGRRSRRARL